MVNKSVIVVGIDEGQSDALRSILDSAGYEPFSVPSLPEAAIILRTEFHSALIIDLDHTSPDNRLLKVLRHEHPNLCLIALSSRSFHPELKEVLSRHIDACFVKSVGYDELVYWLKAASSGSTPPEKRQKTGLEDEPLGAL